ncbi:MAG TPA: zinc ribbon domain-containing protein [candidate division WOR-3 bacterium]|uniref:Zinc ribbon domain-containing protein n=1 Tax=candidate division WOR-3 bacterium TaxID=2052148 RepID=A0A7V5LT46_UNCW3|nr:zinc ribbon domain-containing protein [candidate division WOR-3 bacterium]
MPIYEYKCTKCGKIWEILVLPHEEQPRICPECGGELERIYTGSVGLVFKGSGFYITDYANRTKEKSKKTEEKKKE